MATGSEAELVVSLGPLPADTDDDGDGFTENEGDCDDTDPSINPDAIDIPGDGIDQDCSGSDASEAFASIVVTPETATILTGEDLALMATGINADGTSRNITSEVSWSTGGSVFNSGTAGTFDVDATLDGVTGTATIDVIEAIGDGTLPFAQITAPTTGASVTAPVDVVGSATDANFVKYTLAIAPAGTSDFSTIAEETTQVSGNVLGQLDPTMLLNDTYTLRLTVFDAGGNQVFTETEVVVEEDLKVGNFSISFTDLTVPMSGLPITVNRIYDSRDRRSGDFGYGWRLDVNTIRVNSTDLGTGWQVVNAGFFNVALQETEAHTVSVTLPDGRVETFAMRVNPNTAAFLFSGSLQVSYTPLPGTVGTLAPLDNNFVIILDPQPGVVDLYDDLTFNLYDPQRFRYTAADGTQMDLDKRDGVTRVEDTNGNTLTFGSNGIVHSAGRSVIFARDGAGRITSITDPAGNVQNYRYDANGDLVSHTDARRFRNQVRLQPFPRIAASHRSAKPSGRTHRVRRSGSHCQHYQCRRTADSLQPRYRRSTGNRNRCRREPDRVHL